MVEVLEQSFSQGVFLCRKLQRLFKILVQILVRIQWLCVVAGVLQIASVCKHLPGILVIHADCIDKTLDIAARIRRFNFGEHLNAAAGIAVEQVTGTHKDTLGIFICTEDKDAGVFQISSNNALDTNIIAVTFNPWTQTADTADDHFDLDACLGSFDQFSMISMSLREFTLIKI